MATDKTGVLIVGAGKGGTALVEMFAKSGVANVLAIVDKDEGVPGLEKARLLGLETGDDYRQYLNRDELDLIIDVTGDEETRKQIVESSPSGVEVMGGHSARLMWDIVEEHVVLERRYDEQMIDLVNVQDELKIALKEWDHTFDCMTDGVTIHDVEYNIINANKAICEMLGASKEDLIGKKCYRLFHCMDSPIKGCPMERAMHVRASYAREIYEPTIGKWLSVSAAPVKDNSGNIIKVIHTVRDITDRKIAEEELFELSEFTRKVIDSLPHPFYVIDVNDYTIKMSNKASGFDELGAGSKCYELSHAATEPCSKDGCPCPLEEVKRTKKPAVVEHKHVDSKGVLRYREIHGYPIFDREGNVAQMIEYILDITDRKKAEEALIESEGRYRELIENAPMPIFIVQDFRVKFLNSRASMLAGRSYKDLLDIHIAELVHPDDRDLIIERHRQRLAGLDIPASYSFRTVTSTGETRWVELNVVGIEWSGKPATLNFLNDITERTRAEAELEKAQRKYRELYESSRDAIMILEPPSWSFTAGNKAAIEIFGVKDEEEFKSKKPYELAPEYQPDDKPSKDKFLEMIKRAMKEGSHYFEWLHKRIDGEEFFATVLFTKIHLEEKEALQATVRDITRQKSAEQAVNDAREYLEALIHSMADGLWVIDLGGNTIDVNPAAVALYGYGSRKEMLKKNTADVTAKKDIKKAQELIQKTLNGEAGSDEFEIIRKDGKQVPVQVTASPLKDSDGNVMGGFSVIKDITDRREMEQIREGLIIDVTHELKSPIALMEMAYDMCARGIEVKDFKRIETAQGIAAINLERFSIDVHNMLDMFSVGIQRDEEQLIELDRLVEATVDDLRPLIENKGLKLKIDIPTDASLIKMASREASCLMRNIIGNAVKFTKKGSIEIDSKQKGDQIELKIKDTGCGIKKKDMPRIFDRFFKGSAIMPGTGLGLSVCKKVIELCGGSIDVKSNGAWKGTTVTVSLPRG